MPYIAQPKRSTVWGGGVGVFILTAVHTGLWALSKSSRHGRFVPNSLGRLVVDLIRENVISIAPKMSKQESLKQQPHTSFWAVVPIEGTPRSSAHPLPCN